MAYADQFALLRSQKFRDTVGGALLSGARSLSSQAEPPVSDKSTPAQVTAHDNWAALQVISGDILGTSGRSNVMRWIDVALPILVAIPAVVSAGESITDAQIDAAISAIAPQLAKRRLS